MFESLARNRQEKSALESEKRQYNFAREQNTDAQQVEDNLYFGVQESRSDLLKWQQDFKEEINYLRYKFLGYKLVGNSWIKDANSKPICNEHFCDQVVEPMCSFFLSKNFINSNLTENRINDLLKRNFNNLAKSLVIKHKQYAINFNDFDDIVRELKVLVVPAAYRAIGGWTKKTDSTIFKRIEAAHEKQEDKKSGLFNWS